MKYGEYGKTKKSLSRIKNYRKKNKKKRMK